MWLASQSFHSEFRQVMVIHSFALDYYYFTLIFSTLCRVGDALVGHHENLGKQADDTPMRRPF